MASYELKSYPASKLTGFLHYFNWNWLYDGWAYPPASPDFVTTLNKAADTFRDSHATRPRAEAVVNALLQTEKVARQQQLTYSLESLCGHWQLYFTAPRNAHLRNGMAVGKGFYLPRIVPAQISFGAQTPIKEPSLSTAEISNSLRFGSYQVRWIDHN